MASEQKPLIEIAWHPEYWGQGVTDAEGKKYAEHLARAVSAEFPDADVEVVREGHRWHHSMTDDERTIAYWIERNWVRIMQETDRL